ncbi:hypothetical protein BU23DRAFT_571533 [Bimuria novae-zelandiae CBS 107.79]|uniref:DUF7708 domain-containing protein n=1 Tax=Bimuria novae-zelandiae CBS 107.79 TaxID=1447943 RepID=A0A6A5UZS7_9PLEO|nr:hypothetical protein BU23DRAFT_571533 [Bimuria novae-zelandiae CBS 107.79]
MSPTVKPNWELLKTEEMQRAIADIYAHIFLFLNDTLAWYTKKRRRCLLDSLNEKFLQEFEPELENIIRKSERIKRKAVQMSMAEQRVTSLTLEETSKDLRIGLEGVLRENAVTKFYVQHFSDRFERQWREQYEERNNALLYRNLIKLLTDVAQATKDSNTTITRDHLLLSSTRLEDFFHRDRINLDPAFFHDLSLLPDAIAHLAEWTKDISTSPILCISSLDFSGDDFASPISLLAAKFVEFAS